MSAATAPLPPAFAQALRELGLVHADEAAALRGEPLTGGVSSDIWRIATARGELCVKQALPKLRVAADWRAPIARNLYEARWMQVAAAAAPGSVPPLLGQHAALGVLVMRYLEPARHPLWKRQLSEGRVDVAFARAVGATLARIHAHAAAQPGLAAQFDTDAIFFDIRLEPYLLATAAKHPDLAPALRALVAQTQAHKVSLVHGDVSPKNILVGPAGSAAAQASGNATTQVTGSVAAQAAGAVVSERERDAPARGHQPVFLDAECAWWGDPAFDLAFCLNHLLLKCLWVPQQRAALRRAFDALAQGYLAGVSWEPAAALECRAAALLPGLMLARADGKSPVEYLRDDGREQVRRVAGALLRRPPGALADVAAAWHDACEAAVPDEPRAAAAQPRQERAR